MPSNPPQYEEEEEAKAAKVLKDFDCPVCNANNPYDDGIYPDDEVTCFYCGQEFKVSRNSEGQWRFKEA